MKIFKFRKIVSLAIATTMLLTAGISSFATDSSIKSQEEKTNMTPIKVETNNKLTLTQKINAVAKKGVLLEVAKTFPENLLDELLKDSGTIVKVTKTTKQGLEGVTSSTQPGMISTMSTIPSSQLSVYNFVERIKEKGAAYDNFKFTSYAYWNTAPSWVLVDVLATAWDNSFTLYSDSCTYTAYKYVSGVGNRPFSFGCPRNNVVPGAGIAHNVDLLSGYFMHSAIQVAKVYKSNSTGTANVVTNYAHEYIGLSSISASFGASASGPSIGFTCGWASKIDTASPGYTGFSY